MSRYDNYPDDIRQYDDDPRSPFFNDVHVCSECGAVSPDAHLSTCSEYIDLDEPDLNLNVCRYCDTNDDEDHLPYCKFYQGSDEPLKGD